MGMNADAFIVAAAAHAAVKQRTTVATPSKGAAAAKFKVALYTIPLLLRAREARSLEGVDYACRKRGMQIYVENDETVLWSSGTPKSTETDSVTGGRSE